MKPIIAFVILGLVSGNLVGLTGDALSQSILSAIFAFSGGSIVVFISKFTESQKREASSAVSALAVSAIFGVYLGIFQTSHGLFGTKYIEDDQSTVETSFSTALKSANPSETAELINAISEFRKVSANLNATGPLARGSFGYKSVTIDKISSIEEKLQLDSQGYGYKEAYSDLKQHIKELSK